MRRAKNARRKGSPSISRSFGCSISCTICRSGRGLTYLFVSHDLGVIRHVCDRVALLYRGALVEQNETEAIFEQPRSEYARTLIAAMPGADPSPSLWRMHI